MRTPQNGQPQCIECKGKYLRCDAKNEFFEVITFHGISELICSLQKIHDLALYHTDIPIGEEEKTALFDIKVLWDALGEL